MLASSAYHIDEVTTAARHLTDVLAWVAALANQVGIDLAPTAQVTAASKMAFPVLFDSGGLS